MIRLFTHFNSNGKKILRFFSVISTEKNVLKQSVSKEVFKFKKKTKIYIF